MNENVHKEEQFSSNFGFFALKKPDLSKTHLERYLKQKPEFSDPYSYHMNNIEREREIRACFKAPIEPKMGYGFINLNTQQFKK
jgi:hypothetical protein